MKNLNIKTFIWVLLIISGILWFSIATYQKLDLSKIYDFFKVLPTVVTIDAILIGIFLTWGWKLRIFKGWLVPFPNLNGTWQGHTTSTWINPETGEPPPPIPTILTVKQTFPKISCVMRTTEMVSHSYSAVFNLESDNQIRQLIYTYNSKPRTTVTDRSPAHEGSAILDIIEAPEKKLNGKYWTSRKTTGEIELTFREKKRLEEYPEDLGEHPIKQK
jgi:hypothetical protein